jgi:hypothetical protein
VLLVALMSGADACKVLVTPVSGGGVPTTPPGVGIVATGGGGTFVANVTVVLDSTGAAVALVAWMALFVAITKGGAGEG